MSNALYRTIVPMPPTVNGLFAGKTRRFKSPEYKEWIARASKYVAAPLITFPVRIHYTVTMKNKGSGDLSNRLKAIEDLLVSQGILQDDSHKHITAFSMSFAGYDKVSPRIEVEIFKA